MALWNYCAICGKRIEAGEPCLGIEKKNTEIVWDSICFDCVKVENIPGREESVPITGLLARAEAAEARCKRLEEARENADEAAAKWEGMYHMAEARAEKAVRERDAAIEEIPKICYYCKHREGWKVCADWNGNQEAETCEKWEWRGKKEE